MTDFARSKERAFAGGGLVRSLLGSTRSGRVALLIGASTVFASPAHAQQLAPPAEQNSPVEDANGAEEIIVTARVQKLYRVEATSTGKLPTAPLESSQVITTLTKQLIEDQGARDAQDLYRNISGVSFYSFAGVAARGFRQEEIFYDGLRGDPNAGFSVPQLFNIERVEFLKGPAGMLYGPGAPGGLFNYITKKPTDQFELQVRGIAGLPSRFGGLAEANVPLGNGFAARGGIFYENRDLQRYNADQRTLIADGGVAYDAGPVKFILQATRYDQRQNAARLRGIPVDENGYFLADRKWNANEPEDFLQMTSDVIQGRIEAKPTSTIMVDATVRWNKGREEQRYHEMNALLDTAGNVLANTAPRSQVAGVRREYRIQYRNQQSWSFGTNAVWSADLGANVRNRVLLGFDWYTVEESRRASRLRGNGTPRAGLPSPISLANPVYQPGITASYNAGPFTDNLVNGTRTGFYALDELTVGPLILTGGVRRDDFKDTVNANGFSGGATTYRGGAVYRVTPAISLFGQYATSFEPQAPADQLTVVGGPFAPSAGDIIEGGVKTALMNGRIQTSAAVYRIKRTNVLQPNPAGDVAGDGFDDRIAAGEVTSQGFEFDIAADITPDWVVTVNYAYNDARITAGPVGGLGNIGDSVGDRFANAPRDKLGFWTRYQIRPANLAVAFGGDYLSERISVQGQRVPPYLIFDMSLIYEKGPIRAMLRVDNLFDKTYAASGFTVNAGHYPGRPRSAFIELQYKLR